VIVIVSEYDPAANPVVMKDTSKLDGAGPAPADKVIQDWFLVAVQLSAPPPVFVIVMVCAAGFGPRAVPEGFMPVVESVRFGGCRTTKVTAIVCGDPVAPGALTVTVSVYVPAVSPEIETERPKLDGAVPELAGRVSHDCVLPAVQLSVPPPVFVMFTL
jgi:hypothetical protein